MLLLLPTSTSKLTASWQGPYHVVKKIGKVNYLVEKPNQRRSKKVYHVNLLKKYESANIMCCLVEEVKEEEIPDWRADTPTQPTMEIQAQKKELTAVL